MNERTRLVAAMIIAAVIIFSWVPLVHVVERATGWELLKPPTTQPDSSQADSSQATNTPSTAPTTGPSTVIVSTSQPAGQISIGASPATQPEMVDLGSSAIDDPTFALQMRISTIGAGLEQVTLNQFTERVGSLDRFAFETPYGEHAVLALATKSITINGQTKDLTGGIWRVIEKSDRSATLSLDLTDDAKKPVLTLIKRFTVLPRSEGGDFGPGGYDTALQCEFVNHTDAPLTISTTLLGPTFPASEQLRGGDRHVIAGFQGQNQVILRHDPLESFTGSTATKDYSVYEDQPLLWIGAGSNYFNGIVRPTNAKQLKSATATAVNPDAEAHLRQVSLLINTADLTVAPGGRQVFDSKVFFGPRQRALLKNAYYAAPGVEYFHSLETTSSCAWCTFSWLVDLLMSMLRAFYFVLGDWGLAIIALVFVVRTLLHPITKRSQVNMAQMSKMGPEIERLKKKYGDDKDGLNRAMMQFYKNNTAGPLLGCLPMFLQMPIWIALYSGLSSTFELRQQPFLYGLTWIKDLSQPDHLIHLSTPISFFFLHADGLNIIPFFMAAAFFLQQKLTPKPVAATPEQVQQQKMMQWMTLLFPVMLYSSPSGLNIYIMTSTTFGIIESHIVRKHIKEREAREASGPTIVDAEVLDARNVNEPKKGPGLMGWFAKLQDMAEEARQNAETQKRKKK